MADKKYDIFKSFQRTSDFPLDISSIFFSYTDALKYAEGKGDDERKLGKTSYLGQIISVIENNTVKIYKITYGTDSSKKTLALIGEGGGGGGGTVEQQIKIGDEIIQIGDTLTEALVKVAKAVNAKNDGTISENIVIDEVVVAEKGDTVTEALQKVSSYLYEHSGSIAEIQSPDDDLEIFVEDKTTFIQLKKITNPEFTFDTNSNTFN